VKRWDYLILVSKAFDFNSTVSTGFNFALLGTQRESQCVNESARVESNQIAYNEHETNRNTTVGDSQKNSFANAKAKEPLGGLTV
jgi:hypothetical protein